MSFIRRYTVMVLCIAACVNVTLAQDSTRTPSEWSLRFNPIAPINGSAPYSVQLGIEYGISPEVSVALEGGYYYQYNYRLAEAPDQTFDGFIARLQVFRGDVAGRIGFDVAFKYTEGICRDSIKPDNAPPSSQDYRLARSAVIVRVIFTQRYSWGSHLWSEPFFGLGVRYKSTRSTGITQEQIDNIDNRDEYGDSSDMVRFGHAIGVAWYPEFTIGWRIGYEFNL